MCLPGGQRLSGTHIQHKYSMLRQQVYSKVERINRVETYLSECDGERDECSKADCTENRRCDREQYDNSRHNHEATAICRSIVGELRQMGDQADADILCIYTSRCEKSDHNISMI